MQKSQLFKKKIILIHVTRLLLDCIYSSANSGGGAGKKCHPKKRSSSRTPVATTSHMCPDEHKRSFLLHTRSTRAPDEFNNGFPFIVRLSFTWNCCRRCDCHCWEATCSLRLFTTQCSLREYLSSKQCNPAVKYHCMSTFF